MTKQAETFPFDLSEYIILQPKCNDRAKQTIRIMTNSKLRVSSNLMKELDPNVCHYATVFLHKNKNQLVLKLEPEASDSAVYLKKNGCASLKDAAPKLKERGIKVPACFVVEEASSKDTWIATYDANLYFPEPNVSEQKLSRPRKRIPREVLPE